MKIKTKLKKATKQTRYTDAQRATTFIYALELGLPKFEGNWLREAKQRQIQMLGIIAGWPPERTKQAFSQAKDLGYLNV